MTPEEQARRLVEEWVIAVGFHPTNYTGELTSEDIADLVRRLVPVFERLQEAEGLSDRDYVTRDQYVAELADVEAKLERAEAERDSLRADVNRLRDNFKVQADKAKATVARLKKVLEHLRRFRNAVRACDEEK